MRTLRRWRWTSHESARSWPGWERSTHPSVSPGAVKRLTYGSSRLPRPHGSTHPLDDLGDGDVGGGPPQAGAWSSCRGTPPRLGHSDRGERSLSPGIGCCSLPGPSGILVLALALLRGISHFTASVACTAPACTCRASAVTMTSGVRKLVRGRLDCGDAMFGKTATNRGRTYLYYACRNAQHRRSAVAPGSLRARQVDQGSHL